jgi:transketolase
LTESPTSACSRYETLQELPFSSHEGGFIGMHDLGASSKIADLYNKFDITAEAVVRAAHQTLAKVATL